MHVFTTDRFLSFCVVLVLAGCAVATKEDVEKASDTRVCRKIGFFNKLLLPEQKLPWVDEATRRNLLSKKEIDSVNLKEIYVGMRLCALYASWGDPDRENKSVGSWGVRVQHVYGRNYVYTRNDIIVSYSN